MAVDTSRTEAASAPAIFDAFISYARLDAPLVLPLVEACEELGRSFWVDSTEITGGAKWRIELDQALQSANAVVCMISRAWLASRECWSEFSLASELGKRVIPVFVQEISEPLPPEVAVLQWVSTADRTIAGTAEVLLKAIDTDSELVRQHTQWLNLSLRWQAAERNQSFLARGRVLADAERWLQHSGTNPRPVPIQVEYISASRRAERRRSRTLLSTAVVVVVVALLLAGFAWIQRNSAIEQQRIATARQLLAQARAAADEDVRSELMFDIAAVQVNPTGETRAQLVNAIAGSPLESILSGDGDPSYRTRLAIDPRGGRAATTGRGGMVYLWDLADPANPTRLGQVSAGSTPITGGVVAVGFARTDSIVAGYNDGTVTLLDISDPAHPVPNYLLRGRSGVTSLAVAPDGLTAAIGLADSTLVVAGLPTDTQPGWAIEFESGHEDGITALAFRFDGQLMATGSADHTVLWDMSDAHQPQRLPQELDPPRKAAVTSAAFAPDGRTLATGQDDDSALLWNVADPGHPTREAEPLVAHQSAVTSVAFSPDGLQLATGSADRTAALWDVADLRRPEQVVADRTGEVSAVGFIDNGRLLTGTDRNRVLVWNLLDPSRPRAVSHPSATAGAITVLAYSPTGGLLAGGGSSSGAVTMWNMADPARPIERSVLDDPAAKSITEMAFFADGRTMLADGVDLPLQLIDAADPTNPQAVGTPVGSGPSILSAIAANVGVLGTLTHDGFHLWDVTERTAPEQLSSTDIGADAVNTMVMTSDGKTLLLGGKQLNLWDISDPQSARQHGAPLTPFNSRIMAMAVSADGKQLATNGSDNTVALWDISDPAEPRQVGEPLSQHQGLVTAIAFSTDGTTLVTGSQDKTVALWDISDPAHPNVLGGPLDSSGSVSSVVISPDGNTVVAAAEDGVVTVWDLAGLNDLRHNALDRACAIAGRALSLDEWNRSIPDLQYQDGCAEENHP